MVCAGHEPAEEAREAQAQHVGDALVAAERRDLAEGAVAVRLRLAAQVLGQSASLAQGVLRRGRIGLARCGEVRDSCAIAERGWRVSRVTVMAQVREPEKQADLSRVEEVAEEELRPARAALNADMPWGAPDVMEQLFAGKHVIGRSMDARFFAVKVDGDVVSYTDLYHDGPEAQVEDVGTLPEHRGQGHATAVVLGAIAAARERGAEFVFLVADYEDWPKELYRRLGFTDIQETEIYYEMEWVPEGYAAPLATTPIS